MLSGANSFRPDSDVTQQQNRSSINLMKCELDPERLKQPRKIKWKQETNASIAKVNRNHADDGGLTRHL